MNKERIELEASNYPMEDENDVISFALHIARITRQETLNEVKEALQQLQDKTK